jgi:chorismate synthase
MTAGESHGPALIGIISGLPSGLRIDTDYIDKQLLRRQQGIGRSGRQEIEKDKAEILSGVRHGLTIGSPIAVQIENRDYENWRDVMSAEKPSVPPESEPSYPRPGHADYAGALKWGLDDARNVLERASGRTTAVTVALGSICRQFIMDIGAEIGSRIISFGKEVLVDDPTPPTSKIVLGEEGLWLKKISKLSGESVARIERAVAKARESGDTLGGCIQVIAHYIPPGLGSCALPDERLDSRLAGAAMGIPGIKAVEIGAGIMQAWSTGREAHDEFNFREWPFGRGLDTCDRKTNYAGGIEGGMSNGQPVTLTAWMKPLATVNPPKESIDLKTGLAVQPDGTERSDVAAVESAACVLEAVVALELARAFREKFGDDRFDVVAADWEKYVSSVCIRRKMRNNPTQRP